MSMALRDFVEDLRSSKRREEPVNKLSVLLEEARRIRGLAEEQQTEKKAEREQPQPAHPPRLSGDAVAELSARCAVLIERGIGSLD